MTLHREDLDQIVAAGCAHPFRDNHDGDPTPMYFHARCHPRGRIEAKYADGVLTVSCLECHQTVAAVAVARKGPS